jgi:Arm DNA-binding domain
MKLTKSRVENLAVPESGQALFWDEELRGFGVRVTATGKRTYIVQGRVNGKSERVALGTHGLITCDEARKKARAELVRMSEGKSAQGERKRKAVLQITLRDVATDYIRDRADLKPSSIKDIWKHVGKGLRRLGGTAGKHHYAGYVMLTTVWER